MAMIFPAEGIVLNFRGEFGRCHSTGCLRLRL